MSWESAAPCRGLPTIVFFPDPEIDGGHIRPEQFDAALDVCDQCPFHAECQQVWRDQGRPDHGVWFGTTPPMRKAQRLKTSTRARVCRCGRALTAQQIERRHTYCGPECVRQARVMSQRHYDRRKRG